MRVGLLEPGPLNAITDVDEVAVGHANHAADHAGVRSSSRAPDDDHWSHPVPVGCAVLNGAGEISGLAQILEWGISRDPALPDGAPRTSVRVYDAATQVLAERQPRIGVDDVLIPVVAECDPSWYCDVDGAASWDLGLVRTALEAAAGARWPEGQVGRASGWPVTT